jgi:hypothetical protein
LYGSGSRKFKQLAVHASEIGERGRGIVGFCRPPHLKEAKIPY